MPVLPAVSLVAALAWATAASGELVVSQGRGDDATADGSPERPFRTLTAALRVARAQGEDAAAIRVDPGVYAAAAGEEFPLRIPAGTRIRGADPEAVRIEGASDDTLFALDAAGSAWLEGLTLTGGGIGLQVAPGSEDSKPSGLVVLADVVCEALAVGVQLDAGTDEEGQLVLRARGLRARDCERGLSAYGLGRLSLDLEASIFERCDVGMHLEAFPGEDHSLIGHPDAPAFVRVRHEVVVRDTTFVECREAGFRRVGADGKNEGPPYRFESCTFQGNDVGLELQRPCGDTGLLVRDTEFAGNRRFGTRITGFQSAPEAKSRFEDSLFRTNGVGLHATCVNLELSRNRIVENVGNGVFSSNFMAEPTTTLVADTLIADNGASGFYGLADARLLKVHLLRSTIAGNGFAGVYNKTRHSGTSNYRIEGCIVARNETDLEQLGADSVAGSFIGDGSGLDGDGAELVGDPRFVAPDAQDYRLRADSPCLDRGPEVADSPDALEPSAALDLDGHPRAVGRVDLGAYERPRDS